MTLLEDLSGYLVVNTLDKGRSGSREVIRKALGILQARKKGDSEYAGWSEREADDGLRFWICW